MSNLSQYGNALAAINRARLLSLPTPFFRAWLSNLESEVYLDRWDSDRAMRFAQEGMRFSRALADPWLSADAFAARGEAEFLNRRFSRPRRHRAGTDAKQTNRAGVALARALRCKSWMEGDEGRVTHAMAFMRQAEEGFRETGQVRNAVDAMTYLATIQGMGGDHYAALVGHSSLIPLIRESGKLADLAFCSLIPRTITCNSIVFQMRSPTIKSSQDLPQNRFALRRVDRREPVMHGRGAHRSLARSPARDCWQSKAIAEQLHDPKRLAVTILRLGYAQREFGNTEQAIASFRQRYHISTSVNDSLSQAQSLMDWGDALETLGDHVKAREKFDEALPLSQKAESVPEQIEARFRIARSGESEAGQDEDAKSDLTEALKKHRCPAPRTGQPRLGLRILPSCASATSFTLSC